ncbi:MAG: hypothetical protein KatS3mg082_2935 [Nitrospiraceae bacterium]|nr:MAG: hypothetical protein KatS3mg081_2460 [Gemmatimonadales bacterium]GIW56531.1 MAG: hypothetical protein KatS3mg082_2935 [Nitrospiraceae bacterium]
MEWPRVPLGALVRRLGGGTPSRKRPEYWGPGLPWFTVADLTDDLRVQEMHDSRECITEAGLENSSAHRIPPGSVVVSTRVVVGKVGIAQRDIATNQDFASLIPHADSLDARFLAYYLLSIRNSLRGQGRGLTITGITTHTLDALRIPLPPLSEQRRIVEILDQADRLRRLRAEADAKADRILPALFIKMFGDPATNPLGWPVRPIGEHLEPILRRNPADRPDETFIYIDIAGVDGATGEISETKPLLGAEAPSRARQVVKAGDVLVSTVRPYLRATAMVPAELDGQICSTGFCVLRPRLASMRGYLYALTRTHWFTDQLMSRARGASYPALTDRDIWELPVPTPDDEAVLEQFVALVEALLTQRAKRRDAATTIANLFISALSRAFAGSLTAPWRVAHMKEVLEEMEQQAKVLEAART